MVDQLVEQLLLVLGLTDKDPVGLLILHHLLLPGLVRPGLWIRITRRLGGTRPTSGKEVGVVEHGHGQRDGSVLRAHLLGPAILDRFQDLERNPIDQVVLGDVVDKVFDAVVSDLEDRRTTLSELVRNEALFSGDEVEYGSMYIVQVQGVDRSGLVPFPVGHGLQHRLELDLPVWKGVVFVEQVEAKLLEHTVLSE